MAKPDWLSIDEITRLWSEETGQDPSDFRQDLENWFAAFVKEPPTSRQLEPGVNFDSVIANRLLAMLGARYLERRTFGAYCEERGHSKPRFWFGGREAGPVPAAPADLRPTRSRRSARARGLQVAGLAVLLVGLAVGGVVTAIRLAGNEPSPAEARTAKVLADPAPADGEGQPVPADGERQAGDAGASASARASDSDSDSEIGARAEAARAARLREENARLTDELATARALVTSLRQAQEHAQQQAQQPAGDPGGASRRDLTLGATVSSARVAALQLELEAARQQIADLSRSSELAVRQREIPQPPQPPQPQAATAATAATAPSDKLSAAGQENLKQPEDSGIDDVVPEIQEVQTVAEFSADPATLETEVVREPISSDELLREPDRHSGREVVVTGPVVWLLRQFWLQSDSGQRRMMIDVDGLKADDRKKLEDALVQIDHLAQMRARIRGTIESLASEKYRLAATELTLGE